MKEFIMAALPFVIIGICIIILCMNSKKKDNCILEGMSLGMCFGVTISTMLNINLGYGISFGMLIGETIGSFIIKKNKR